MYIIDKNDILNYRFAIAKEAFLQVYSKYKLIEDIENSNCMRMQNNGEEIIVSVFSRPKIKFGEEEKIHIFYDDRHYKKEVSKKVNNYIKVLNFTDKYMEKYETMFENAIKCPEEYLKSITDHPELHISCKKILLDVNEIENHNRKFYKYYSKETIEEKRYGVVDGKISFVDPNTFNDPFDVNCFFANESNMSKLFRILCVTYSAKEILMWSYYGSNHEGYCLEYNEKDILKIIQKLEGDGLCIIGEVEYKDKRPKQKSRLNSISITELNFYIQAAFTKYTKWNHEKEYRYVLLSNSFLENKPYITEDISIEKVLGGCRNNRKAIYDTSGNQIKITKLSKDNKEYELHEQ